MFSLTKKTLLALAGIAAFAAGGATFAGAATKRTSSSPSQRAPQTQLTGDTADKVKAAAEAKVPGGTVLRVEEGGPSGSAYHAHVRTSDGNEVVVLVNSSFEATSVETRPAGDRGGRDHGRRGPGGRDGRGGRGRETALTGDTAAKVKAAAEAKVPGGTVLRVENDADSSSPYEAHVRASDGSEVVVLVNSSFEATSVTQQRHP
jgi:predicted enzyme related to lactoylglutathione lyase